MYKRQVYDLDENGERIQRPSGNGKCHKENTVDWNDQKYAEVWRHSWETVSYTHLDVYKRQVLKLLLTMQVEVVLLFEQLLTFCHVPIVPFS